jgi:hypothetical protein
VLHSDDRREIMNEAVVACALAVGLLNALPGLLGVWIWYRGAAYRTHESRARSDPGEEQRGALGGSVAGAARAFWILLRVGQGSALVLAALAGALAVAGRDSNERLFYLYALLPLAVGFVAEQLRTAAAQTILDRHELPDARAVGSLPESDQHALVAEILTRETIVMALSALVVVFLALRAAGTAHGF